MDQAEFWPLTLGLHSTLKIPFDSETFDFGPDGLLSIIHFDR